MEIVMNVNATKEHILRLFREAGLGEYETEFEQYITPSNRMETMQASDEEIMVGETKIGGNPDLPPDYTWPRWKTYPMSFIAQINLASLSKEVLQHYDIPSKGILSFFYTAHPDAMYGNKCELFYRSKDTAKVFYFDDQQTLTRTAAPFEQHEEFWFKPCKVKYIVDWTIPGSETYEISKGLGMGWNHNREVFDKYCFVFQSRFIDKFHNRSQWHEPIHRFLGNHDPVQSGYVDGDHNLLLQIDSDNLVGTMWGDTGRIYFFGCIEKLKRINVADAYAVMECT